MANVKEYLNLDEEIFGGLPVFKGTRVPVKTLFNHLSKGDGLEVFLDDFPSVTREQANGVLEIAGRIMESRKVGEIFAGVE